MRRKRKAVLTVLSAVLLTIAAAGVTKALRETSIPAVLTVRADVCRLVSSVYTKGSIFSAQACDLCADQTVRVVSVEKHIGDSVKAGDVIFTAEALEDDDPGYARLETDAVAAFRELYISDANQTETVYFTPENGKISVVSPIDGVVSSLPAGEGARIRSGERAASVINCGQLKVAASVPENYAQDIRTGLRCDITGEAFRDRCYAGEVEQVMPFASTVQTISGKGSPAVDVVIGIDAPDEALKTGYSARVEIYTKDRGISVVVPYEAVRQDGDNREYVFVCSGGTLEKRYVKTGVEMESIVEILAGLTEGELIAADPDADLTDGMRVRAVIS